MLASAVTAEGCLVAEAGAFRSIYAIGVLDALLRNDLNFTSVVGISAGGLIGSAYMTGAIGQGIHFMLANRENSRFIGWEAYMESCGGCMRQGQRIVCGLRRVKRQLLAGNIRKWKCQSAKSGGIGGSGSAMVHCDG